MCTNGNFNNPVVVQPVRMNDLTGLQHMPESRRSWYQLRSGPASENKQEKDQASLFHIFYVGCYQKVWPRLKLELFSKDLD